MDAFLAADFSIATAFMTAGFLYMLVSVVAWLMLINQGAGAPTIWCLGGVVIGVGVVLVGLRATPLSPWVTFMVGNSLLVIGNLMHVLALSRELDRPLRGLSLVGAYVLILLPFSYFHLIKQDADWRFTWITTCLGLLVGWTALLARMIARREGSKSAYWLALFNVILMLELASRGLMTGMGWSHPVILKNSFENLRVVISVLMVGVLGNIMIIGLYLERAQRASIRLAVENERQGLNARLGERITELFRERSMDEVSISVAHELGQPITGMLVDIDRIRTHFARLGLGDEQIDRYLKSLEMHALRSRGIIGTIRSFVKSDAVDFGQVNVCAVLDDVIALFSPMVHEGRVHFEVHKHLPQAWIRGDALLLSLVLHNLFRNAVQARPDDATTHIRVELSRSDTGLRLLIEDDGPGFSADALSRAGNDLFTTKSDGMGVGLALCRRIIEEHDGTVTLTNRDSGFGARVTLDFATIGSITRPDRVFGDSSVPDAKA